MTTAIRLYRTYILSTFVPLNTIRSLFENFSSVQNIRVFYTVYCFRGSYSVCVIGISICIKRL